MSPDKDEFVLGADGKPLLDRYGRPVRRRGRNPAQRRPRRSDAEPTRLETFPAQSGRPSGRPQETRHMSSSQQQRFDAQRRSSQHSGSAAKHGASAPGASSAQRPRQYFPPQQQAPHSQAPHSQTPYNQTQYAQGQGGHQQFQPAYNQQPYPLQHQQQAPRPAAPHRGHRRRRRRPFRTFRLILVLLLVVLVGGTVWADLKLNRIDAMPDSHIANTAGTNWLLVGSDSREGMTEEDAIRLGTGGDIGSQRTDTIMLLHIPTTGKATLVSLPRDSYVAIPDYGMDKLNSAFAYGGPQLLITTVEQSTGLRIDHYAEIGMGGLANVTDAVGGIEVCPAEPIVDPLANLDIAAGCQQVDGPTALGYVRTRATAMGDLDRVQRQREFFASLVDQLTSPWTLLNPFRLLSTITAVAGSFTVDEGDHIWHLARVALAMRSGVQTETVPYAGFASTDVGDVVIWDDQAAEALFASMR